MEAPHPTPTLPDQDWDVVLRPRTGLRVADLREIWRYRDLAFMFFKRDFVALYKQTILGPIWYLIQPLMTALTYYVIFGRIAQIPTGGMPPFLFYISGIIVWTFFSVSVINNGEVFSKNAQLFGKVYFPRIVMPLAVVMSGLVAFAIQFLLLLFAAAVFMLSGQPVTIDPLGVLLVPAVIAHVGLLGLGVGLIVSSLTVRFRDLAYATTFVIQLWMFASPVVYPFSQIPARYQWFFMLNPMSAPVESLRQLLFGSSGAPPAVWYSNIAVAVVLLGLGLYLFSRAEATAMDTV